MPYIIYMTWFWASGTTTSCTSYDLTHSTIYLKLCSIIFLHKMLVRFYMELCTSGPSYTTPTLGFIIGLSPFGRKLCWWDRADLISWPLWPRERVWLREMGRGRVNYTSLWSDVDTWERFYPDVPCVTIIGLSFSAVTRLWFVVWGEGFQSCREVWRKWTCRPAHCFFSRGNDTNHI